MFAHEPGSQRTVDNISVSFVVAGGERTGNWSPENLMKVGSSTLRVADQKLGKGCMPKLGAVGATIAGALVA
jgi:hypothetical protein